MTDEYNPEPVEKPVVDEPNTANDAKSASDAIAELEAKDGEANNESARTNEILAHRVPDPDYDPIAASLKLNDPTLTRSAYTSHESGFNEDLMREAEKKPVDAPQEAENQSHTVNEE